MLWKILLQKNTNIIILSWDIYENVKLLILEVKHTRKKHDAKTVPSVGKDMEFLINSNKLQTFIILYIRTVTILNIIMSTLIP